MAGSRIALSNRISTRAGIVRLEASEQDAFECKSGKAKGIDNVRPEGSNGAPPWILLNAWRYKAAFCLQLLDQASVR